MHLFCQFLVLVLCSACLQATTIRGRVQSASGQPLRVAHVHLADAQGIPITSVIIGSSGRYKVNTSVQGVVHLVFSAVDHEPVFRRVLLHGQSLLAADAVLSTAVATRTVDSVLVTGDFNGFDGTIPMQRRTDGTFIHDVEASQTQLRYQIQVVTSDPQSSKSIRSRFMNGSQSDRFEYDSGGDYRSVLIVKPGIVRIDFDPSRLPLSPQRAGICTVHGANDNALEHLMRETDSIVLRSEAYLKQALPTEYEQRRDSIIRLALSFLPPNSRSHRSMQQELAVIRSLALTKLVRIQSASDNQTLCQAFESIPPNSAVWSWRADLIDKAIAFCPDRGKRAISDIAASNTAYDVRPSALYALVEVAMYSKDSVLHREAYAALQREYPNHRLARYAQRRYPPAPRIAVGKTIPKVAFEDLTSPHTMIDVQRFQGSYLLIDTWATWCQPCVAEIPALRSAWDAFKGKKLQILSISMDRSRQDATRFLQSHAMPWYHAFSAGIGSSSVADALEVTSIPKPILVDPHGIIVEVGESLRGENLSKTLATYLPD